LIIHNILLFLASILSPIKDKKQPKANRTGEKGSELKEKVYNIIESCE